MMEDYPEDAKPPPHINCRCIIEFGIFDVSWRDEIEASLTLHVGNTSPLLPEYPVPAS